MLVSASLLWGMHCVLTHSHCVLSRGGCSTPIYTAGGRPGTCEANDGALQREACDRSVCSEDCAGYWGQWEGCTVSCGSGGQRKRTYIVTQQAERGGLTSTCEADAGAEELEYGCNAEVPCPVNCAGSFGEWSDCTAECGGGSQTRAYRVDTPAAHGGSEGSCGYADGYVEERDCGNSECPIGEPQQQTASRRRMAALSVSVLCA